MSVIEELTAKKKKRLRIVCARACDERIAKKKYKTLGPVIKKLQAEAKIAAAEIIRHSDYMRRAESNKEAMFNG